jgi:mono/diheme cytochrome c family protein
MTVVGFDSDAASNRGSGDPPAMSDATKRCSLLATVAGLVLMVCSTSTFAAGVERGKQLARRSCSVCHVVLAGQRPGVPPAPSFRSIAKSPQFRAKGAKLLWEVHGTMPNLALTGDEADDLAAYIKTLAK